MAWSPLSWAFRRRSCASAASKARGSPELGAQERGLTLALQLRLLQVRRRSFHGRRGAADLGLLARDLRLRDGDPRLRRCYLRLRAMHLGLVVVLLDQVEKVALVHRLVVGDGDLADVSRDPRFQPRWVATQLRVVSLALVDLPDDSIPVYQECRRAQHGNQGDDGADDGALQNACLIFLVFVALLVLAVLLLIFLALVALVLNVRVLVAPVPLLLVLPAHRICLGLRTAPPSVVTMASTDMPGRTWPSSELPFQSIAIFTGTRCTTFV